jgi:hypothetical protein
MSDSGGKLELRGAGCVIVLVGVCLVIAGALVIIAGA